MLRRLLKSGLAWGVSHAGIGQLHSPFVVGYHRTVDQMPDDPKATIPSLCITVKMLERQLDWIGRRYKFVSLDDLERASRGTQPVAAVTFDDGYQDFYELAYPLLKRKGIPATVFVVTDLIGTLDLQIHDRLYLLLARSRSYEEAHAQLVQILSALPQSEVMRFISELESKVEIEWDVQRAHRSLTWEEIAEMQHEGITIGSHTRTHTVLPNEDMERVAMELRGSRTALESKLGVAVRHFAYPCGQFNAAAVSAVAQAGYDYAYTICEHCDGRYPNLTVSRKVLWENSCLDALGSFSPSIMTCHVNGWFDRFARCKMNHGSALCWS